MRYTTAYCREQIPCTPGASELGAPSQPVQINDAWDRQLDTAYLEHIAQPWFYVERDSQPTRRVLLKRMRKLGMRQQPNVALCKHRRQHYCYYALMDAAIASHIAASNRLDYKQQYYLAATLSIITHLLVLPDLVQESCSCLVLQDMYLLPRDPRTTS